MFREYDTDFNIQFVGGSGSIIDQNINYYAEDDAMAVNIWDEDSCIATLIRVGDDWICDRADPFYVLHDPELETDDFDDVMEFVARLNEVLETV